MLKCNHSHKIHHHKSSKFKKNKSPNQYLREVVIEVEEVVKNIKMIVQIIIMIEVEEVEVDTKAEVNTKTNNNFLRLILIFLYAFSTVKML